MKKKSLAQVLTRFLVYDSVVKSSILNGFVVNRAMSGAQHAQLLSELLDSLGVSFNTTSCTKKQKLRKIK